MFDLPKYGDGVCLARMAELLEAIAVDRAWLQRIAVVVTGSNGKGSTAAFCAGIGRALGLRTGLFTSPHLYRFNERFQIDGAPIGDAELADLVARIGAAMSDVSARRNEKFGSFEAMFALACRYFQDRGCDFAVFEAGIGGRYDPVRLVGARSERSLFSSGWTAAAAMASFIALVTLSTAPMFAERQSTPPAPPAG